MPFVLDASVALSWHFEDETSPFADRMLERLQQDGAVVPPHWPLEMANGLVYAERRERISGLEVSQALELTLTLPVFVHDLPSDVAFRTIVELMRSQGLSAYDAAYLNLALRQTLPLATLDNRLRNAAMAVGVPVLE